MRTELNETSPNILVHVFGPYIFSEIIEISTSITRLNAKCNTCGAAATCSHRKNTTSNRQLLIGNENIYEALCEKCFEKNNIS